MRGSIKQRSKGSWTLVVDAGRDPVTGKRKQKSATVRGTKKEAQEELAALITRISTGAEGVSSKMTLSQYLDRWLDHQRENIRPRTHAGYVMQMRTYVRPVIGHVALHQLKAAHVELVLDKMRDKGLSPRTRIQTRAVLGASFRQAMRWQLLTTNPAAIVKPPKADRPKLDIPSAEQLSALITASKGTPWEIPLLIACTTGARRSEVLGIQWSDVDLKSGTVRIARSLQWIPQAEGGRRLQFVDLKTPRARRSVALPTVALARLRQHNLDQKQQRLALGPAWQPLDLVCDRGDGGMLDPDAMTKAFKRLAAEAGLSPKTRLHDVRHGVATALAKRSVHSVIVSSILGHASPAFTASVYQHAWDEGTAEVATAMGDALNL